MKKFRRQVLLTAVLPIFISLLTGAYAADAKEKDGPGLPLYETEEIAAPKLEQVVREKASEVGLTLKAVIPQPPKVVGKFTGIGLQGKVSGTSEEVVKFLSTLENRDQFIVVPDLAIAVDRKDSSIAHASFALMAWYATKEKVAGKTRKWEAAVELASDSAMDLFTSCAAPLEKDPFSVELIPAADVKKPELAVRLTEFWSSGKTVNFSGEAQNSSAANKFAALLFKNESLKAYEWVWEKRPKYNTKRKDGTVDFAIVGKLREKGAGKKAKRKDA